MGSEIFSFEVPHNGAEKITEDGAGVEWVYNNYSTKDLATVYTLHNLWLYWISWISVDEFGCYCVRDRLTDIPNAES